MDYQSDAVVSHFERGRAVKVFAYCAAAVIRKEVNAFSLVGLRAVVLSNSWSRLAALRKRGKRP
jgi:hypothetical protein